MSRRACLRQLSVERLAGRPRAVKAIAAPRFGFESAEQYYAVLAVIAKRVNPDSPSAG